jgi:diguanylate cyclase (GGDEF)-like protein
MAFQYLYKITDYIDSAFTLFYNTMLKDSRLGTFFESQDQVDALIEKQKKHFVASLSMDIDTIKQSYIRLGEFHYDARIPYVDFMRGTEILQEHFLIQSQRAEPSVELMEDIFEYFKIMKSYTAKGYLNRMILEDKKDMDSFFEQSNGNENLNFSQKIVMEKILWLKDLVHAIETKEDFEIESSSRVFDSWLRELHFMSKEKQLFLEDLQQRVLINTQNLFSFLKRSEYFEILPLYTSLLSIYKLTLMMNNALTLEYASNVIENMKIDTLTQLFRKDFFKDILEKELILIGRNHVAVMSIIYIDLDNFKEVNDHFGHYSGDKVIEKMGEIIRTTIRSSDYGFRIGGDEFALILRNADRMNALKVAEKIKTNFTEYDFVFTEDQTFRVGLCMGIVEQSGESHELSIDDLIQKVDDKLYEAKGNGKNSISS